jgi:hypothetical protein
MNSENFIIKIQKWFRGNIFRIKRLPLILYKIQKYLQNCNFEFTNQTNDGRINSCIDEEKIIVLLLEKFNNRIKKPNIRMWYDILVFDNICGWLPVNIKTTTTKSSDNTGNLAMCVYAYTDEKLDVHKNNTYENGKMSELLIKKIKEKKYNKIYKKDYYFIVLNKNNSNDIIVNSVLGLQKITPNNNNLPFQIMWNKNRNFIYNKINYKIKMFIECLQQPKPSWKETFMENVRTLKC